jgi:hypothetical protein
MRDNLKASNDVYERLGVLEQLVQRLCAKTRVPMPDLQTLGRSQVSAHVQQMLAFADKMGAVKAFRAESNVDLPTASRIIESL